MPWPLFSRRWFRGKNDSERGPRSIGSRLNQRERAGTEDRVERPAGASPSTPIPGSTRAAASPIPGLPPPESRRRRRRHSGSAARWRGDRRPAICRPPGPLSEATARQYTDAKRPAAQHTPLRWYVPPGGGCSSSGGSSRAAFICGGRFRRRRVKPPGAGRAGNPALSDSPRWYPRPCIFPRNGWRERGCRRRCRH